MARDKVQFKTYPAEWITRETKAVSLDILTRRDWGLLPLLIDALDNAGCYDEELFAILHSEDLDPQVFGLLGFLAGLKVTAEFSGEGSDRHLRIVIEKKEKPDGRNS